MRIPPPRILQKNTTEAMMWRFGDPLKSLRREQRQTPGSETPLMALGER
jgi:hypothetical protein